MNESINAKTSVPPWCIEDLRYRSYTGSLWGLQDIPEEKYGILAILNSRTGLYFHVYHYSSLMNSYILHSSYAPMPNPLPPSSVLPPLSSLPTPHSLFSPPIYGLSSPLPPYTLFQLFTSFCKYYHSKKAIYVRWFTPFLRESADQFLPKVDLKYLLPI